MNLSCIINFFNLCLKQWLPSNTSFHQKACLPLSLMQTPFMLQECVRIFMTILECLEFYVIGNCINLSLLITRFRLTFEGGLHGSHLSLVHRVLEYYFEVDEQVSVLIRSLMERHTSSLRRNFLPLHLWLEIPGLVGLRQITWIYGSHRRSLCNLCNSICGIKVNRLDDDLVHFVDPRLPHIFWLLTKLGNKFSEEGY